ncbi:MAG: DUF721 domain-containing protein [Verrucomicrobiota bacterium]|nr:DUF721 domain-containing protein [Verrucomicrobiota bacterium]
MADKPYQFSRQAENLIANLRGVPEDLSPVVRETVNMDVVFDKILRKYKIGVESLEDRIREKWIQIVGPANANHCYPIRIENESVLFIAVSNPIIRQELQFNQAIILRKLACIENGKRIRRIVFRSG